MHSETPLSIYLHIPFCETRCAYCAFNVYTNMQDRIPAYVDALCREARFVASSNPHALVHTIYFGGGTPSLLPARYYEMLLDCLRSGFAFVDNAEISLEANPNDLSVVYLKQLRKLGINRLSIGMQSATDKILRLFDRRHDMPQVNRAVFDARAAGFQNVNLDVIFGSPHETLADWRRTLNAVIGLSPDHVSMYGLELKGGTPLRRQVETGELPTPDDDLFADMYELATERLAAAGYDQYEISNWSRAGRVCRHNLQYWRCLPYLGLGAGAHGLAAGYRYSVIASPDRYIAALTDGEDRSLPFPLSPAAAKSGQQSNEEALYEHVMMGLRLTRDGIQREDFRRRFGFDFVARFEGALDDLGAMGLVELNDKRVRLTARGRLLSNFVIRELV